MAIILEIGAIIFAAGGGYTMLRGQADCNAKQEQKLTENDKDHAAFEKNQAVTNEQLRQINEKLNDIKGVLEMYRLPH